ncbi:predicted protein [Nematostella vectensis]|uniref:Uncharacterized protein n=1 Tax=Nematostella vectensis TaxID=45351 RepID=A7S2E4_NEMVE|nr:predicted protein [Nematostella vectensis]|eukprot:XP_001634193.1 predicted protein [Nematostella vectensis]
MQALRLQMLAQGNMVKDGAQTARLDNPPVLQEQVEQLNRLVPISDTPEKMRESSSSDGFDHSPIRDVSSAWSSSCSLLISATRRLSGSSRSLNFSLSSTSNSSNRSSSAEGINTPPQMQSMLYSPPIFPRPRGDQRAEQTRQVLELLRLKELNPPPINQQPNNPQFVKQMRGFVAQQAEFNMQLMKGRRRRRLDRELMS